MTQTSEQYDAAIAAGVKLFMQNGFAKVSIEDIVASTGLNRYSIYSAFGTKADFFKVCVRRYCATAVDSLQRLVNDSNLSHKEVARANLYAAAEEMCDAQSGCLVCENMTEMRHFAPDLAEHCRAYYAAKEKILVDLFERASALHKIPADIEPDQAAAAFMVFKFGLSNEVKRTPDIAAIKKKIDAFVSAMFRD